MKFLVDENVGISVAKYLKKKGYDVVIATAEELKSREDIFLVNFAFKEKRIIITNDKDFGYLIYRQRLPTWGIILFRFIKESSSLKIKILEEILSKSSNKILNHFIVINEDKVRIRKISK